MKHPMGDFHPQNAEKPNLVKRLGFTIYDLRLR
jgi:hypothetical protein